MNYGYRRNVNKHVIGFVKLGENVHKILTCCTFLWGVVGAPDIILLSHYFVPKTHIWPQHWKFVRLDL